MKSLKICVIFSAFFFAPLFVFPQNSVKSDEAKAVIESRLSRQNKKNADSNQEKTPIVYNEDFEKGEELFSLNEPEKAIPYFEKSLEAENVDPAVYVYLGVAYYQTGDFNKSLSICVQGLAKENTDRKVLAYNAGNSCYAMGNYLRADASYAIAIREDDSYAPAVLNRANAQLKMDHLEDAKNNYIKYLGLVPENFQHEKIENLIELLTDEIERRAKQKPELINPDEFVENEKMEIAAEIEKVDEIPPAFAAEKSGEMEKIEAAAPALPVVKNEQNDGEKINENLASLPPENQNEKNEENDEKSEKILENIDALLNQNQNQKNKETAETEKNAEFPENAEKISDILIQISDENLDKKSKSEKDSIEKSERVKENPPLPPVLEKNEKASENPDEKIVLDEIPENEKAEDESVESEKINPNSLLNDDYQKNEK